MAVNVMITDDHSMIREGLRQLLELEGEFKVVAEACDGIECLEKLETVTLASEVTSIGNYAFRNCKNLSSVYCPVITPPDLGHGPFEGCDIHMKIYVPESSVNEYKQKWSSVADKIVGY